MCRRAAGVRSDEFVGEVSMIGITNALWDMMMRGVCVMLLVDGLRSVLQFVAVCCSMLQCVLECVAVPHMMTGITNAMWDMMMRCVCVV